jgi:hypothetical protein
MSKAQRREAVTEVGAVVVDREDDPEDRNEAVVVNLPPATCAEWVARQAGGEDVTVADDNPEYDPDAEVVVVAFREDLRREDAHPDWNGDEPITLPAECRTYAFPRSRLERVGHIDDEDRDPDGLLTDGQRDLRERLADSAEVTAAVDAADPDAAVLVVEKLGSEHRITADGTVDGGPLADRIADVAAEYLGGGDGE